jgi:hypothetical protein
VITKLIGEGNFPGKLTTSSSRAFGKVKQGLVEGNSLSAFLKSKSLEGLSAEADELGQKFTSGSN